MLMFVAGPDFDLLRSFPKVGSGGPPPPKLPDSFDGDGRDDDHDDNSEDQPTSKVNKWQKFLTNSLAMFIALGVHSAQTMTKMPLIPLIPQECRITLNPPKS